jgi:hypothetical protein
LLNWSRYPFEKTSYLKKKISNYLKTFKLYDIKELEQTFSMMEKLPRNTFSFI